MVDLVEVYTTAYNFSATEPAFDPQTQMMMGFLIIALGIVLVWIGLKRRQEQKKEVQP